MTVMAVSLPLTTTSTSTIATGKSGTNPSITATKGATITNSTRSSTTPAMKRRMTLEKYYYPRSMRKHTAMSFFLSLLMILTVPVVTYLHPGLALAQAQPSPVSASPSVSQAASYPSFGHHAVHHVPSIAASSPSPSLAGSTPDGYSNGSSSCSSSSGTTCNGSNNNEEDFETFLIISPYETNSLLRRPSCEHTQSHLQFTNTVRVDQLDCYSLYTFS